MQGIQGFADLMGQMAGHPRDWHKCAFVWDIYVGSQKQTESPKLMHMLAHTMVISVTSLYNMLMLHFGSRCQQY